MAHEGWTRYDKSAGPYTGSGLTDAATAMRSTNETTRRGPISTLGKSDRRHPTGDEKVIPIVEEQLSVGKREVERGRVRVRSYVVETPVEETCVCVTKPSMWSAAGWTVRRATSPRDAFRERTIEVTETDEEAVVAKTARVTEEVVISKDVTERTERVSDTVRRTEVDVENTAGTDRALNRTVKVDRDLKADRDRDI